MEARAMNLIGLCALLGTAGLALAAPIVYPAKGQTSQQQQTDQGECHVWAVQNTGVDPGMWVTGLPASVQVITHGQEIVFAGQTVVPDSSWSTL